MDGFPLACVHPTGSVIHFGSISIGCVHDHGIYVELSLGVLTGVSQDVGGPSKIARLMTSLRATCARCGRNRRTSARYNCAIVVDSYQDAKERFRYSRPVPSAGAGR